MRPKTLLPFFLFLVFAAGCAAPAVSLTATPATSLPTATATLTATFSPTFTQTVTPSSTTEIASQVCSPLQGIPLEKLRLVTSNTFVPFPPYVENGVGHPAIDFSFYQFEQYTTFADFPIQAILPGKVILVEDNRFPYGYMLLIETPLSQVAPSLLSIIPEPTPLPESAYSIDDRCPVYGKPVTYDRTRQSLYILYAHLAGLPLVSTGDLVSCGELIGYAGKSGNAAEAHLHLEARLGPSNAAFTSIASYHSSTTDEERYNYCIWSISGVFRAIDPAVLLYPK